MSLLGMGVGAGMEFYNKITNKEKENQEGNKLREVCLDTLEDSYAIDFRNRREIEAQLNNIRDVEQLREISDLIGKLTDNLLILNSTFNSEYKAGAVVKIKSALRKLKEKGLNIIIKNNIGE